MKNKIQSEILILFVLVFGLILFYIATSSVFLNFNNELILLSNLNPLSIVSTFLFISITFLGLISDRNYLFFLPFMLLAMPSPVDDIFPSICLTSANDAREIFFPLFTHIDIYLLVGILRKAIISRPNNINSNLYISNLYHLHYFFYHPYHHLMFVLVFEFSVLVIELFV